MSNRSAGYIANREEPDIQVIKLHKSNSGMGLSIVAAKVRFSGFIWGPSRRQKRKK
jgi:hypothetical protein